MKPRKGAKGRLVPPRDRKDGHGRRGGKVNLKTVMTQAAQRGRDRKRGGK